MSVDDQWDTALPVIKLLKDAFKTGFETVRRWLMKAMS